MSYPEKLPDTRPTEPFPVGDPLDEFMLSKMDSWLREVSGYNKLQVSGMLGRALRSLPEDTRPENRNHWAAYHLCAAWDERRGDKERFARDGFTIVRACMNATRILPPYNAVLSGEIKQMNEHHVEPREFGRTAWAGMWASHRNIARQHERLYQASRPWFDLAPEINEEYFRAGMALPYLLSSASCLINMLAVHDFNGMKECTVDALESMDFKKIFTNKAMQPHEDFRKRKSSNERP